MTPQAKTVLSHLQAHGPLTGVEAEQVYKVRHLPSRIFEIKKAGVKVLTAMKKDATGQKYARYSVEA